MNHRSIAFITGLIFAVGLGISGMTQPTKVIGFLDVTGAWDPSLVMVMGGAVVVYFLVFNVIVRRRDKPIVGERFGIPSRRDIDPRLLGGAVLFGAGWGLGGFCPGPALTSAATGMSSVLIFVAAMLAGMGLHSTYQKLRSRA
ncbi:MAG: YeeE/YedE family protein [Myxococcales bacterium]|nr:YeeE/YedE family protein [Myxococcales bacterium]MCB9569773.1 YeeE/YedE family protein [Myxococcales bacterium]MCB9701725.1 YeeE/YedE family protein [Myxococcales bacterium]